MKKCNFFFHGVSCVWKSIPKSMKTLLTLPFLKGQWVLSFSLYCSICLYQFLGVCFALSFLAIISSPLEYSPKIWSWFIQHLTCEEKEGKGAGSQTARSRICGHSSNRNGYMIFILCSCKSEIAIDFCLKVFCGQLGARAYETLLIFTSLVYL